MKRWMIVAVALVFLAADVFCLEVAERELDKGREARVEFVAYGGPYDRIDTREAIVGIGEHLGRQIAGGRETGEYSDKYRVLRVVDASDPAFLSADILILREASQLDQVDNLRRIISGYLRTAFGYAPARADRLAELAIGYNALYRGELEYFSRTYAPAVVRNLSAETAGLARRYSDWPGRSRLVIPLTTGLPAAVPDRPTVEDRPAAPGEPPSVADRPPAAPTPAPLEPALEAAPAEVAPPRPSPDAPEAPPATAETLPGERPPGEAEPAVAEAPAAEDEAAISPEAPAPRVPVEARGLRRLFRRSGEAVRGFGLLPLLLIILGAALLLWLVLFLLSRLRASGGRMRAGRGGRGAAMVPLTARQLRGPAGEPPIEMRVQGQNPLIGRRNIHVIREGGRKTVGGHGSDFLLFLVAFPPRIGEIRRRGGRYSFTPRKAQFFPEQSTTLEDCLGKPIRAENKDGRSVTLRFRTYVSPLERVNRILRLTESPGAPEPHPEEEE